MGRMNERILVDNQIRGTRSGTPFSSNNSFYVEDSRRYAASRNIAPGRPAVKKSRPIGTVKRVLVKARPIQLIPVRSQNRKGKWFTNLKPLKIWKTIVVYPKRRSVRNKRRSLKGQVGLHPNGMSRVTWKIGKPVEATVRRYVPNQPQYTEECSGNLVLSVPPWNWMNQLHFDLNREMDMSGLENHLDGEAIGDLLDRVQDQKVNLAQAFAERRQTIGMIADSAVRLGGALTAIRKGNLKKAMSSLLPHGATSKQLSNDWLVLQYGIKPLISDVEGLAVHLAKLHYDPPRMKVVARKKKKFDTVTRQTYPSALSGPGSLTITVETEVIVKYSCEIQIDSKGLSQASRLGFTNLPLLGWELLTGSFVIDWFLPIGDYLARLSSGEGVKVVDFYRSVLKKRTITVSGIYGGYKDGYLYDGTPFNQKFEKVEFYRDLRTNLPKPRLPEFKDPLSTGHLLNAIALLRQMHK